MKKFWKVLGITAAVAALTPYHIDKDEETGEKKVEALLWRATAAPKEGEEKLAVDVRFGFNSPFSAKSNEPLFDEEPVAEFEVETAKQTTAEADKAEAEADKTEAEADKAEADAAEAEVEAVKAAAEAESENTDKAEEAPAQNAAEAPAQSETTESSDI